MIFNTDQLYFYTINPRRETYERVLVDIAVGSHTRLATLRGILYEACKQLKPNVLSVTTNDYCRIRTSAGPDLLDPLDPPTYFFNCLGSGAKTNPSDIYNTDLSDPISLKLAIFFIRYVKF